MVHIAVRNLAGKCVIAPAGHSEPLLVSKLRQTILEKRGCPCSRFKLLQGSRVLQNTDVLEDDDPSSTITVTMVTMPPAGISEQAEEPLVLPVEEEHQVHVDMFDLRTHREETLPFRYFLDHDGAAHIGVLAVDLAPMIGANVVSISRMGTVQALYDGESRTKTLEEADEHGWLWQVVGGAEKGGVIVRAEKDLQSEQLVSRLATGAWVRELALEEGRLHYKLVSGTGPLVGWVSVHLRDKNLLIRASQDVEIFRDVILVGQLPRVFEAVSSAWGRQNGSFLEVGMKISHQLDEIVLATQDMDDQIHGSLLKAVRQAQASTLNWWSNAR
mmetsp:Transcript_42556/g.74777  ORF Transcript_42556/g.74777 Transcript_42556/m.74777 type:complete len:329 (+) Transcript_42556:48-1034(+)